MSRMRAGLGWAIRIVSVVSVTQPSYRVIMSEPRQSGGIAEAADGQPGLSRHPKQAKLWPICIGLSSEIYTTTQAFGR